METCRICGEESDIDYISVKERMLGKFDEFLYFLCPECDCLQIKETPKNLVDYYPNNYYSYKKLEHLIKAPIRTWIDSHRVDHLIGKKNIPGFIFNKILKSLGYIEWIRFTHIKKGDKILDIGCGQGRLLHRMALGGFTNLTGVDPFLKEDVLYSNGVNLIKSSIEKFAQNNLRFDLIMLHHSLEHIPDQHNTLKYLTKILSPGGKVIIRIPLADSYAWKHYKECWVQLDAPRHLYLHSKKSLVLLAKENDLGIERIVYDSSKFQFTGSELYLRDIPLNSDKKTRNIFSKQQLKTYVNKSKELNKKAEGDQAVFYMKALKE